MTAALHLPNAYDSERNVRVRVDELIELLGLGQFRTKFVRELSTGSRRIVDLACLLAHRPTVILLDEPSSGIAQRETEALGPLLLRIRDETGASLVVIEHDMPLVRSVTDRLVAMDQGAVIADGPPDEVLADPQVVASYLGTFDAHRASTTEDMQPSSASTDRTGSSLRRWGPLVAIVAAVAVIAVVVVAAGGGDDDGGNATATTRASGAPQEAISFSEAAEQGLDVTFPDTCDEETGRVAIPSYFAPECYANVDDNGGATAPGVTEDTITVVVYLAPETDPVLDFITGPINADDTPAQVEETYQGYADSSTPTTRRTGARWS